MASASLAVDFISFGRIDSWIVMIAVVGGLAYGTVAAVSAAIPIGWVLTKYGFGSRFWLAVLIGGLASVLVFLIWEAVVYSTAIDVIWWPVTRIIFVSAAFLAGATLTSLWHRDRQRLTEHSSHD
ncbi:hypothetical protein [Qipengyuania marisflavi]|uniref:Uncharacterized protein n=1 Tax=Qipengyuania marisflavi TaxID=2486356 RepID=A0A5S3P8T0_9SPHN|nr:hypothetical protein [Qipengyuania marisflavi]TMM49912.1 hypothetical protein FEV51_01555 [Qipengyuania marisflavi]